MSRRTLGTESTGAAHRHTYTTMVEAKSEPIALAHGRARQLALGPQPASRTSLVRDPRPNVLAAGRSSPQFTIQWRGADGVAPRIAGALKGAPSARSRVLASETPGL